MTRQTLEPLDEFRRNISARNTREIANLATSGDLLIETPYQRGSVWTPDQRIALIRSLMTGVPIPSIIWNDRMNPWWRKVNGRAEAAYALIDGKQRVETLVAWYGGKLAVPASWFAADAIAKTKDTDDGPYVTYTGLTRPEQLGFALNTTIPVCEARLTRVEDEANVFLLVNGGGTPQTDADMARAARVAKGEKR